MAGVGMKIDLTFSFVEKVGMKNEMFFSVEKILA